MVSWNLRILYKFKKNLWSIPRRIRKRMKKHAPHNADSFDDFFGTPRSMRSFFSNMSRISISSHSGGISLFSQRLASCSTYVSPLTTRHRVLAININPGVDTGAKFPSLNLCKPVPHFDQCRHAKTYETERCSKLPPLR